MIMRFGFTPPQCESSAIIHAHRCTLAPRAPNSCIQILSSCDQRAVYIVQTGGYATFAPNPEYYIGPSKIAKEQDIIFYNINPIKIVNSASWIFFTKPGVNRYRDSCKGGYKFRWTVPESKGLKR